MLSKGIHPVAGCLPVVGSGWGGPGPTARQLMEPLAASALRQCGWQSPTSVPDTYMLRVYELSLDMAWLRGLLIELGLRGDKPCVTGGNYVLPTFREGMVAHKSDTLERWGRAGAGPYNLALPPRPQKAAWMQRAR